MRRTLRNGCSNSMFLYLYLISYILYLWKKVTLNLKTNPHPLIYLYLQMSSSPPPLISSSPPLLPSPPSNFLQPSLRNKGWVAPHLQLVVQITLLKVWRLPQIVYLCRVWEFVFEVCLLNTDSHSYLVWFWVNMVKIEKIGPVSHPLNLYAEHWSICLL